MSVRIAISIGDVNGIGPEVILKSLAGLSLEDITPVVFSDPGILSFYGGLSDIDLGFHAISDAEDIKENTVNVINSFPNKEIKINPGQLDSRNGSIAMDSVQHGLDLCMTGQADALVTAPISKEAINMAGYRVPGHTEFLADQTGCKDFMMMLIHEDIRVGLVTIHEPIAKVPSLISEETVYHSIDVMNRSLARDFNIDNPEIAVLGLNPHAGDGGHIGSEEISIITPALKRARQNNIAVTGPLPADGFFGNRKYKEYDGVLAMYHDQGLVPFKTLSFGSGVNFTAGLPIIRTSPDHGTAFDIAGENKADPSSFKQALKIAAELSGNRKTYD